MKIKKLLAKAEENFDIGTSLYSYVKKNNKNHLIFLKKINTCFSII